jgi:hypothetical protein
MLELDEETGKWFDTDTGRYDEGTTSSGGSSGSNVELDPISGEPVSPGFKAGTPGPGWGNAGDWGTLLTELDKGNYSGILKNLFGGTGFGGKAGQMAAFGGLAMLLNKMFNDQTQKPVGYQGGIPKFTYERTQTPMAQQRPEGYRPGQGGITYFAPSQYTYQGRDLAAPNAGGVSGDTSGGATGGGSDTVGGGSKDDTIIPAAGGGYMPGGITMLAKGRYLRGNGDGVSDSIPARFAGSGQEARLADGEFVIPARVVSELGNGSSDAGARKLYAMLDRVEARAKKAKRGKPSGADRELNKLA